MYFYVKLKGAGINTNMHVEPFHNMLKHVYTVYASTSQQVC